MFSGNVLYKQRHLLFLFILVISLIIPLRLVNSSEKLSNITKNVKNNISKSVASQNKIDKASDKTDMLLEEYKSILHKIDSIKIYNEQVTSLINSQSEEIENLKYQVENATMTGRMIMPLIQRMIDSLETFTKMDVPFLMEERNNRISKLKKLQTRSDIAVSEKFRQVLEAYQVENEYGRTIEAYKSSLDSNGEKRTVNFLRVGRIVLLYQTFDAQEAGVWNQQERKWQKLPEDYKNSISKGLRIARKFTAPDLMLLPVFAAKITN